MKRQLIRLGAFAKLTSVNNFIHLSLNQGINVIVALVVTPHLFQTLGEDQFGLVNLGLTVILLLGVVVNYGFNQNMPKELALLSNEATIKEKLINEVINTRLLLCGFLFIALSIAVKFFGLFPRYSTIIIFASIQLLNEAVYPMFILQGFDRLSWISKANVITKLLYLALVLLVIKEPLHAKWVNFFMGGTGVIVHCGLLLYIYKIEDIRYSWVRLERVKYRILDNFHFFSSTIASYVLINGGVIVLSNFVSDSQLGYFSIAQRVSIILRMIPVFLTQSILQSASRLHEENSSDYHSYLNRSFKNGLLMTLSIGVFCLLFANWIVRLLAGEYIPVSADLMRILGFLPFLGMLNVTNIVTMLVKDQKRILSKAIWATTIFMLALSTIGGYFFGSIGLAWALLLSELLNFFTHSYLLKRIKSNAK